MKFLFPAIAIMLLAGCNSNMVTHRKDFSPTRPKGEWNDYNRAIRHGEKPEVKKELKDR
ncbi:MAG: hypothetical protein ABIP20_03030 [Chthoniobacteraceae bacterium]